MKKRIGLLVLSIISVLAILFSSTYALLFKVDETEQQSFTTGNLMVTSDAINNSVTLSNSLPMSDEDGAVSTPYTFKITNTGNLNFKFDVKFLSTITDTSNMIDPQYIKIKVNDNDVVALNTLTNGVILSDQLLGSNGSVDIILRVWLSEDTPNTQIGKTFNAKISTEGYSFYTNSVPNNPDLLNNSLIPVYYDENEDTWKTTSYTNENNEWYNYNNKKWANAVLLTATKREEILDDNGNVIPGQIIGDTETAGTLAFYVWIPRYKYKVWNINKVIATDSYNAYSNGIDIMFEKGTASTGTIRCNYDFSVLEGEGLSEKCTGTNGEYYTHPAFTFGGEELTGIWVGKFEISSSDQTAENNGGGDSDILNPRILPNVISWRNNYVDKFWKVIYNMQTDNNEYSLTTDRTIGDSHMITNMEWGAMAYLTHSKYGRCTGGNSDSMCTEVQQNYSSSYYTGRSTGNYTYNQNITVSGVVQPGGQLASTTGNVYGIYDMNGGSWEYVYGNMSGSNGSYTYYRRYAAGTTFYTYTGFEKYLSTYANGTTYTDQNAYNRTRLGDATGEVILIENSEQGAWFQDNSTYFENTGPWLFRSGRYSSYSGIFYFMKASGTVNNGASARAAISVF